jgi:acetyl-CoA carboxylase carboxyl transferase subunit beta
MAIFKGPKRYTEIKVSKRKEIPEGLWVKCESCGQIIFKKGLLENLKVCPKCDYHFVMTAPERIEMCADEGSFKELYADMEPVDVLSFKGPKTYKEKLASDQSITHLREAALVGDAKIFGKEVTLGVTDSRFIMGSMGSVVGEKLTRIIERATEKELPVIIISGSGGGARMYEGMISLMQMAKTSAALAKHHKKGLAFISVLTNPTMAGVLASFASLGDVIVAEPNALIGFTGPRVIEQTIRQKLPPGFQKAEFLLDHGLVDLIVHRKLLKETLGKLIYYLT